MLTVDFKDVFYHSELTDYRLLAIMTDNVSSGYSKTLEMQSTLEPSRIEWPALNNHMPCMTEVIRHTLGVFMSRLGVHGGTKSGEAHERDQQDEVNETIEIGKSQTLRTEGNARINMLLAMRSGLAIIIEKQPISRYFEYHETDLHIVDNACCIDYTDPRSLNQDH
jgi:hypothetical protein